MAFYKFKASRLFDGTKFIDNNVLVTKQDGTIEAILPVAEAGEDIKNLEGILLPGLINCHCHLELSHLKDVIPPHTGLIEFLCSVVTKRGFDPAIIQACIDAAEKEMWENGIVAVGDIGNTADTAATKSTSKIYWQNFVEVLSFTDEKAPEHFLHYQEQQARLQEALAQRHTPSRTTLVPHAPYSISPKTFELINQHTAGQIISIHNQEHPAENELYQTGGGDYLRLFKIFGMEASPFPVTGLTSIQSVLPYFNQGQTIFLIHNTCMTDADISWANTWAATNNIRLIYCLCINANLYIENKVPPVELLQAHGCEIVLGTDSYSSNWELSIAKEIQSICQHFPNLPLENILQWATLAGAQALQWENQLGSFIKGKQPGITLLDLEKGLSKRVI
ncbi:MAG: amidohydrolase family protein [Bacteroidetes bacterium]|nr:amidohydrolase family protein [Bacteroidota bacterium]